MVISRGRRLSVMASMLGMVIGLLSISWILGSRLRFGVWPSRLSPLDALRQYHGPVLIIGGARDTFTPPDETRRMYEAAPGRKTLWLAPGVDHEGVSVLSSADYRARVLSFLEQTIGAP
jgi:uncharacterized protein